MAKEYPLDAAVFEKVSGLYEMDKMLVEFYKRGDLLFMKFNGQIEEAMVYKGDNRFEGGLGFIKARFGPLSGGGVKAVISYIDDDKNEHVLEGQKILKYRE
jgi:hypothetical protein